MAAPAEPVDDEIRIISANVPTNTSESNQTESSSVWSLSLNPFSYYLKRNEKVSTGTEQNTARKASVEVGRVESVTDETSLNPQLTSTPN